jgi:hypothetical protein
MKTRLLKINKRKVKLISTVKRLLIKSKYKKPHKSKKKTIKPRQWRKTNNQLEIKEVEENKINNLYW